MHPRLLGLLTGVAVLLGAFIWLYERELPSTDERSRRAYRLLDIDAADVVGLRIQTADHRVELRRDAMPAVRGSTEGSGESLDAADGGWWLVEPVRARADSTAADALVDSLARLETQRTLDDIERGAVGLEPPTATLTVQLDSGEWTLEFGAEVPASSTVLAAVVGDPAVHVVDRQPYEQAQRTPEDWRSRGVSAVPVHRVDALRVEDEHGTLQLRRDGTRWLRGAVAIPYPTIGDLLAAVDTARAVAFLDGATGTGEPLMTLTYADRSGRKQVLTVLPRTAGPGGVGEDVARELVLVRRNQESALGLASDVIDGWRERIAAVRAADPVAETPAPSEDE